LIIHMERFPGGERRIAAVDRVKGMAKGEVILDEVYGPKG